MSNFTCFVKKDDLGIWSLKVTNCETSVQIILGDKIPDDLENKKQELIEFVESMRD